MTSLSLKSSRRHNYLLEMLAPCDLDYGYVESLLKMATVARRFLASPIIEEFNTVSGSLINGGYKASNPRRT